MKKIFRLFLTILLLSHHLLYAGWNSTGSGIASDGSIDISSETNLSATTPVTLTGDAIGLGTVFDGNVSDTITLTNITQISTRSHTSLTDIGTNTHAQIDSHIANVSNPHSVTALQVGAMPTSRGTIFEFDEFISGGSSSGQYGKLGWRTGTIIATGLTVTGATSTAPNFGQLVLTTAAVQTNGGWFYLAATSTNTEWWVGNVAGRANWNFAFTFKLAQTTGVRCRIGVTGSTTAAEPTNGVWLRYDTSSGFSDTNFMYECRASSVTTSTSSTIAADTNFHTIVISSASAGTITFALYNSAGTLQNTNTISTNVPTSVNVCLGFSVTSDEAITAKSIGVDYFSWLETGLSR